MTRPASAAVLSLRRNREWTRIQTNQKHFLGGIGRKCPELTGIGRNNFLKNAFFRKKRVQRENTRVCRVQSRSQHEKTGLFPVRRRFQRENTVSIYDFGFTIYDLGPAGKGFERRDAGDPNARIEDLGWRIANAIHLPSSVFAAPARVRLRSEATAGQGAHMSKNTHLPPPLLPEASAGTGSPHAVEINRARHYCQYYYFTF